MDVAKCPTMHSTAPMTQNDPTQNVSDAVVEKARHRSGYHKYEKTRVYIQLLLD